LTNKKNVVYLSSSNVVEPLAISVFSLLQPEKRMVEEAKQAMTIKLVFIIFPSY